MNGFNASATLPVLSSTALPQAGIAEHFSTLAKTHPSRVAFYTEHRQIRFGELYTSSLRCASSLKELGLGYGDRCIVNTGNSIETAIAILSVWQAQAVVVLINDQSPDHHIQHAVQLTQAKVLITNKACEISNSHCKVITESRLCNTSDNSIATEPQSIEVNQCHAASIVFTSGSTGMPKGVTQSHKTLIDACQNLTKQLGIGVDDRILCPIPWSFDYGFGQLLSTLLAGIPQVIPVNPNPFEICRAIEQSKPTVFAGVPSLYANLLFGVSPVAETNLSSIRLLTSTGSHLPHSTRDELTRYFYNASLSLNYGLTETYRGCSLPFEHIDSNSVGKAIDGVQIHIIRKDGTLANASEIGEIVHCGTGTFMCYWGDEQATASCLKHCPVHGQAHDAVFTGDLGYLDERGLLYLTGRRDRIFKSMGVRISPEEIECLLLQIDSVTEAAVIGRQHKIHGEMVVSYLVSKDSSAKALSRIREQCKMHMSPFMLPRLYCFMDSLPKTVNGKVDYPKLRLQDRQNSSGKDKSTGVSYAR